MRQRPSSLAIIGNKPLSWGKGGALGGTRTPNLLIRSQMLYPLSYERSHCSILQIRAFAALAGDPAPAATAMVERSRLPSAPLSPVPTGFGNR